MKLRDIEVAVHGARVPLWLAKHIPDVLKATLLVRDLGSFHSFIMALPSASSGREQPLQQLLLRNSSGHVSPYDAAFCDVLKEFPRLQVLAMPVYGQISLLDPCIALSLPNGSVRTSL